MSMETIEIEGDCFISPQANIFAEPGRAILIKSGSFIGANAVLHGPITIGENVGINHHVTMEGGKLGIKIGNDCRIAAYTHIYAFNHSFASEQLIDKQPITSKGIQIGNDVWLGAHCGITDGVNIGNGAVVGMQSVVTKNIAANTVVAGNPATFIKLREQSK